MKKHFTLLVLMLLASIGTWAQTPADGIYTIVCPNPESSYTQRGAIAYKPGNEQRVYLAQVGNMTTDYTNATGKTFEQAGACGYWGIKTYGGKTWFYNLGNAKTVSKPTSADQANTWADIDAENYVTIESSTAKSGQFWIKGNFSGSYLSVSSWWGTQGSGGVRWYNNASDNGCNLNITAVEASLASQLKVTYATNIAAAEAKIMGKADPIEYYVFSGGVPAGVVIKINGTVVEPEESWTMGATYMAEASVSKSNISVENCGDGNVYDITVDNINHQININFTQLFEPIASLAEKDAAKSYYIKNPQGYYPHLNASGNMLGTNNRKEADKFIFINGKTVGQYYIYDLTAGKFVYATSTGNGTPSATQNGSKIQFTADQATAKCWTFDSQVCITPEQGGTAGWNFCGGSVGYVLSLWDNDDGNSKWEITDSNIGSLACAVTLFSEPGKEYMHKLVAEGDVTVQSIELLDELASSDLVLKEDRAAVGNQYKYVWGHAPEAEGTYYYNVVLSDNTKAKVSLTVSSFLQAPTPGMVWVSWNWFKNTIDATNLTETADGLVAKGLKAVGFNTIVIDDAWGRGTLGDPSTLAVNTSKFPNMKSFVDGVNAKGIKVGIYSDAAGKTCGQYQPGSLGYEKQHIAMFDGWGIDFLKYDFCFGSNAFKSYKTMGDAIAELNATRKAAGEVPFVFNACEWGTNFPWTWGAEAGSSMWRATQDAREDWVGTHQFPGVLGGTDEVRDLWMYAGVNRFNDLDMMCIGLHGKGSPSNHTATWGKDGGQLPEWLTPEKARTQMSLWCMLASPLSISCDVRTTPSNPCNPGAGVDELNGEDLAILTNETIISISQDALGQQAEYMPNLGTNSADFSTSGMDVYVKDLTNGRKALAVVNRNAKGTAAGKTIQFADIYLDATKTYTVEDVWAGTSEELTGSVTTGTLAPAQTKVYILTEKMDTTAISQLSSLPSKRSATYDLEGRKAEAGAKGITIVKGSKTIR